MTTVHWKLFACAMHQLICVVFSLKKFYLGKLFVVNVAFEATLVLSNIVVT